MWVETHDPEKVLWRFKEHRGLGGEDAIFHPLPELLDFVEEGFKVWDWVDLIPANVAIHEHAGDVTWEDGNVDIWADKKLT